MLNKTNTAPPMKLGVILKSSRNTASTVDVKMETDVANALRILSAYFITSATIIPPSASKKTTQHTSGV